MDKKTKTKNYLDKSLHQELSRILNNWASRYAKHGFQRQAKVIRDFSRQASEELGGL